MAKVIMDGQFVAIIFNLVSKMNVSLLETEINQFPHIIIFRFKFVSGRFYSVSISLSESPFSHSVSVNGFIIFPLSELVH